MFKRFSNTRARAPCNPRRGAVFAPKWAKKFCKPALRQLAKFRVHSCSSVIKNRALVSFSALSRLFALIRPTPSAFYHSSRKLTSAPPCGASLVLTAYCRWVFLLETQKEPKRSPLLPIARAWRRTTSAAIPQSGPARVLQSPTGALIASQPHSSPA